MSAEAIHTSPYDTAMYDAQLMTGWFMEVFMGGSAEHGELPPIAQQRIDTYVKNQPTQMAVREVADKLWKLPAQYQEAAIYYFCGYPDEAFGMLTDVSLDQLRAEIRKILDVPALTPPKVAPKRVGERVVYIAGRIVPYEPSAPMDTEAWLDLQTREYNPDEWQQRALCPQVDPEVFFPEKGGSTREAKKVCSSCEVQAECLEYALGNEERFGIWGGLSERERRKLKKRKV